MIEENKEKDYNILFEEIEKNNPNNIECIYKVKEIYEKIIKEYNKNECEILKESIWDYIEEIKDERNSYDNYGIDTFYIKLISIMMKASKLVFNYEPRKIQIISVLFFLFKEKTKGLIEQIFTGEGKSMIISFLAVIKALEGKKIDILTSSSVLAERDSKEMEKFYRLFGLSVSFCTKFDPNSAQNKTNLENECYSADIVYGDTLCFEGDILRTNFMEMVGRGNKRPFDCIIIDEIDNICVDNIKNITELLDDFHGYKFLEYIYLYIFNELKEMDKKFRETKKNDEYFNTTMLMNKDVIVEALEEKAKSELLDFNKLKERKKDKIIFPEHLANFVKNRLKHWCESAFDAMYIYKKDKQYIISKDERYGFDTIKPVDFFNTGVIQENSVWTGLHQFLEIKEELKLTEENLNSCYMSNLIFFQKYITKDENNIYGLTGTLGTEKSQEALKILYNLNILFIPAFKMSRFKLEKELIINNEKDYNNKLFEKIKEFAICKNRAVLVIFKYIKEVNQMYNFLIKNGIPKKNIIKYSRNDKINEKNFLNNEIIPQTIILSTNLSGRGTDIKISKNLEKNKGLHVILTFMPISERIEKQAFGRAGRKGQQGSGQYIIMSDKNYKDLIDNRNKREGNEFKFLINIYKKKIDLFQEIFDDFSIVLNSIKKRYNNNEYIILDIKERWGLFLIENDLSKIEKEYKNENSLKIDSDIFEKTRNNYTKFKESINEQFNNNNYTFLNPLILSKTLLKKNCDEAIRRSPILTLGAYLYRIFLETKQENNKKEYLNFCFEQFTKLEDNCTIINNQFEVCCNLMKKIGVKEDSDLFKQNKEKIKFLNDEILSMIRNNLRFINEIKNMELINKEKYYINYYITAKRKFLKEINIDQNGEKKYNKDIIEYFKDFGGMCLFNLVLKKKIKSIIKDFFLCKF